MTKPEDAMVHVNIVPKVFMTRPENENPGDMIADGTVFHSVFDNASPGVCKVDCFVVTIPDNADVQSSLKDKIQWSIGGIQGATLSWQHDGKGVYETIFKFWSEMATFKGLPEKNDAFGEKKASYTVPTIGAQGNGRAKIFFSRFRVLCG